MAFTYTSGTKYNKIILVRIGHAEYKPSFTDLGGGLYKYSVDRVVSKVTRNGVDLTEVTSTPSNNDEFYFDEDALEVTVKLASAPNSTSNVVIINTYLFFTNERARVLAETPTAAISSTNPRRDWEPKVSNTPTFRQSIRNNLSGILTTSASSVDIINTDNSLNPLFAINNSFANRPVEIWIALDDESNIEKIYSGIVTGATIDDTSCTFKITDVTGKLDQLAWLGDDEDEAVYSILTDTGLDPTFNQLPRRFYIGTSTRFTTINDPSITGISDAEKVVFDSLETAVNINRSDTISTSTNREWDIGRSFNGPVNITGTISSTVSGGFGSDYYTFNAGTYSGSFFIVGQRVSISGYSEKRVIKSDIGTGNITVDWTSGDATPSNGTAFTGRKVTIYVSGVRSDGKATLLPNSAISSVVDTATAGGNVITKVTLVNNFEASVTDFSGNPLNPEIHRLGFLAVYEFDDEVNSPRIVNNVLESVLEKAGVVGGIGQPVFEDSGTVSSALQFSIPLFDEPDYDSYRKYIELILLSVNGVLYTDVDKVVYSNIGLPTTQSPTISTNDTLARSRSMEIDYRDISYITTGFNPHSPVSESGEVSNKHRYLHSTSNASRYRHVAYSLDINVKDVRSKLDRNRKAIYAHSTFSQNLGSLPSDNLTLEHDLTDTPSSTKNVFITEITKSTKETRIKSSDLLDD